MKSIFVPGQISGKEYEFVIGGDEPTADDRQFIDSYIRQQEAAFAERYQETFGENLLEPQGLRGQVSEFFRGIPRGAGGLFETAALGLVTPFSEETELRLREGIRGIGQSLQERWAPAIGREETVGGRLGEGVGSILGIGGAGVAAGLVGGPVAGFGTAAGLGAAAGAGEASERARAADATQEERNLAARLGILPGVIDVLPLVRLSRVLERTGAMERLRRIALSGGAEGLQEGASSIAQNLIEQGIYNPERGTFEGVPEDFGYGAGAGGLVQAILDLTVPGRLRRRLEPQVDSEGDQLPPGIAGLLPPPTPPAAADAPDIINVPPTGPDQISPAPTTPEARATDPAPTQQAEATPPVAPEQTRTPNAQLVNALEEMQVPRRAAVSRLVRSGQIQDMESFRERLGRFAAATTDERAARVNQWLQTSREQALPESESTLTADTPTPPDAAQDTAVETALDTNVSNTTLAPEAKAEAAAPVVDKGRSFRERFARAINEGRPEVLRTPEGINAVRDNPMYNLVYNPDGSATIAGIQIEPGGEWVGQAPTTQETQDAETTPSGPVGAVDAGDRAGVEGGIAQPDLRESAVDTDTTGAQPPDGGAVGEPLLGARQPDAPEGAQPAALEDVVTQPEAAPDTELGQLQDPLPTQLQAPESDAAAADTGPSLARDATPGQVTGAGPQVIPSPVLRDPPTAPQQTAPEAAATELEQGVATPPAEAQFSMAEEALQRELVGQRIAEWFETNAPADVQAEYASAPALDRDTTPLPARDLRAVENLLRSTKPPTKGRVITSAQAALLYFGRSPDAGYAFNMIAYDAALANAPEGERGPKTRAANTGILEGQGWGTGQKAQKWIESNLSPETNITFIELRDGQATRDKAGYVHVDYESTRVKGQKKDEQIDKNMDNLVDQLNRENQQTRISERSEARAIQSVLAESGRAPITLAGGRAPWSEFAGQFTWPADAHPRVGALVAAGRFGDAVRVLAQTAPNSTIGRLAERLSDRIANVQSQVVPAETMVRIRDAMSPETPTLGVEAPSGVYIHLMSDEAIAAMRREGHNEAADIVQEYGGQILFNTDAPLAPELVMHEAAHAAADTVLNNKSHPLTRQLDKLRTELLKFMPATTYGLSNVREFLAEGMTNPMFRQELSYATVEGRPYSAWKQFRDIARNWLRGLMGLSPIKPDTALTAVDRALDAVLSANPNEMNAGDIMSASFAPGAMQKLVGDIQGRMTTMGPEAKSRFERFMQDPRIPQNIRSGFSYFGQGLEFLADNATKYLPSARELPDLMRQHKGAIQSMDSLIRNSLQPFSDVMAKYDGRSDITNAVARVALRGSAQGVNVIEHPLSHYEGYSFRYNQMDADGNVVKSIESKRYRTELERNRALQDYNAKLPSDAPRVARARRGYDSSPEDVALYRALEKDKQLLQREAPDVIAELKRMRAIPEQLRGRLADALRARIEALAPKDKAQQNKIFNRFYSKITAESLMDYYFALSRQGNYWIEYSGYDADTGRVEVFKSSFVTPDQQQRAIQMLQRQNERYYTRAKELMGDQRPVAEFQRAVESGQQLIPETIADQLIQEGTLSATEVRPYYQSPSDPRVRPPTEMMARIFESLEDMAGVAQITDPNTGQTIDVREQIVDLFLDSMPESSFLNTFRKRAGTRGFENDITYLQDTVTAGDLTKNFLQNNSRLANQIVSMEYGAKFETYRTKIDMEKRTLAERLPATDNMYQRARKLAEAESYHQALVEHSRAPFRVTGNLASSLVGLTYASTLGLNVSTAVLTTMSLPVFYAPYAAGKYGYGKTLGAMSKAARVIAGSGREKQTVRIGQDGQLEPVTEQRPVWDVSIDNIDYTQPNMAWMRDAHQFWADRGMFLQSPIMSELLGESPNLVQKITSKSAIFQHLAERAVRENALVSTYIMELQSQMGDTRSDVSAFIADLEAGRLQPTTEQANAAAAEAITISEKTNGPMLASMGPRASISDLGRVVYLFKRHPLAMMNNMFQTVGRSFGPDSPDRAIARRQLTGMMTMLATTAGLMGLPMMQQVAMFYDKFLREEDEPDFVTQMRVITGELGTYGALDYLFGTRTSERIGLGGAIYREGFQTGQMPPLFQLAEGFGGPVVGLALKYTSPQTRAHLEEERYGRFMEAVLPTAMANFFRANRYASEGIQNLRGDILVDDIGPFHIAAQALGFMPASYAQQLAINSLGTRINNAIESEVQRLMRKRNMAIFQGDQETLREVMEEIRQFQQRHPGRIDRDTLRSSQRAFLDRSQRTHYGLMVAPRNKAYIDSILDQIGEPSIWGR